jgi:hypothetical protein
MTPSPVVALNHAVSELVGNGPRAGLQLLNAITGLDRYHLFHAARSEMLLQTGDPTGARDAFRLALTIPKTLPKEGISNGEWRRATTPDGGCGTTTPGQWSSHTLTGPHRRELTASGNTEPTTPKASP